MTILQSGLKEVTNTPTAVLGSEYADLAGCESLEQRLRVDQSAPGGIEDHDALFNLSDGLRVDHVAGFLRQRRRGRLLYDLLVAALYGAFTFMEVDDVTEVVGEHLYLDVAWVLDILLDKDGAVAEVFLGLA